MNSKTFGNFFSALLACTFVIGLSQTTALAQVTVYGNVLASDTCKLRAYDPEYPLCLTVIVPFNAKITLKEIVKKGSKRKARTITLRSNDQGEFAHRGVPAGTYDVKIRSLRATMGSTEDLVARDFLVQPSRVKIPSRKRLGGKDFELGFGVEHKLSRPTN